jgi:hypothetical protein
LVYNRTVFLSGLRLFLITGAEGLSLATIPTV